jgi:hypothetical protein
LPTESALVKLQSKSFLDDALRRVLEEAVFAEVMPAREQNHGVVNGRNHQLKTYAAYIRLDLAGYLLAHIFGMFVIFFVKRTVHLLD